MKINAICKTPDPEERRKVLQALYDKYGTVTKCAKALNVEIATFSRWGKKYGVKVDRKKTPRKHIKKHKETYIDWKSLANYAGYENVKSFLEYYLKHYGITQKAASLIGVALVTYRKALVRNKLLNV